MEENLPSYPDNSAVPIIITSIIGKHIDNVNPGGEERFKLRIQNTGCSTFVQAALNL